MAPDHALAARSDLLPADLLQHAAILPSHDTFTRRIIDGLLAPDEGRLDIILETNYLETIKVMASANLGWSILPRNMADEGLTCIPLSGLAARRRLGAVTRRNRTLSPGSNAMLELLRENADAPPAS